MRRLVDRERELEALGAAAESPRGQLVVVWGGRRAGKSYLLQAFSSGRRTIYHTATRQSAPVELASFTDQVRQVLASELLPPGYSFPDWSTALEFLSEHAGPSRLVTILDEFPHLADSAPGLQAGVQRWWDQRGRQSRVMLVLCGLAGALGARMDQRATLSLQIEPMDYRAAGRFVPRLSATGKAIVYGILGGTPLYLDLWDQRASLKDNLVRLFADPASPVVDAAELVLSSELPEREGAFRILQAVANGRTRAGEIRDYADVAVERPLKRLTSLGILERVAPALDDPARTKRATYRISDPYFRFWFRFIAPNRPHIARGLGTQVVERIQRGLDNHMRQVFVDIAREHARGLVAVGELEGERVARWWNPDGQHEIDLVGVRGRDTVTFVGTAKWSQAIAPRELAANFESHVQTLPGILDTVPRLLYCRSAGAAQPDRENVRVLSIDDLY